MPKKQKNIVKVRWVKHYHEATSHVCIGEIVRETNAYVVVLGNTYHFEKNSPRPTPKKSRERVRWIPWNNIALITQLPSDLNWQNIKFYLNDEGRLVYKDYTKSDDTAISISD